MAGGAEPVSARAPAAGAWPGIGVTLLLAALTLGTLAVVALRAGVDTGLGAADMAALRFTVSQALVSALLSVLLAVPLARALARRRFAGRGLFILLTGAPFILPVIVAVLGLLAVWGRAGLLASLAARLGLPAPDIYGFRGVVLAHVFFNLPLATRLFLQGWQRIPAEHFRLADSLGMDSRQINRRLERPMLRAVLPGAFATVFLLCVTSFAVALTLGGGPRATTLELAIYQAFRFDFDLSRAALLAVMQFALSALAAGFAWHLTRLPVAARGLDRVLTRRDGRDALTRAQDVLVLAAAGLFLLLPLVMVLGDGLAGLARLPAQVWPAALRSLAVALGAAVLATAAGLALAQAVLAFERTRAKGAAWVEAVAYLPLAASPMVIGTGLFILLFPLIAPGRVALALVMLVNAMMALPFALRTLLPALRAAERDFGALAESLGMPARARFRLVTWPRIRPEAGFAAGLAAALSMGDLGVVALFTDPARATLPMVLWRLMGAYRMEAASGAALLLLALSLILFLAFGRLGGRGLRDAAS